MHHLRHIKLRGFLLLLLGLSFIPLEFLEAQPRSRVPPSPSAPADLDPAEGEAVIDRFRAARYPQDYSFLFNFRHYPRRGAVKEFSGQLWGSWNQYGPILRVRLNQEETREDPPEFVFQNGHLIQIWSVQHQGSTTVATPVEGSALHESILPELTFTPFDLQMPFLYWKEFDYEGPDRVRGRPAHHFLFHPPEDFTGDPVIGAVRVTIDAHWNAMLRAQVLDPEGEVRKTYQVLRVRRVDEEWVVRSIDLIDEDSRAKTRFEVRAANLQLQLPEEFFDPRQSAMQITSHGPSSFTWF